MPKHPSRFASQEEYNAYHREYRAKNKEKIRAYKREYNKEWRKKNGYHNEIAWALKHPKKVRAEQLLRHAVARGDVKKEPCVICKNENSVAHHPNYRKALEIIWLCHAHHWEFHYRTRKKIDVKKD